SVVSSVISLLLFLKLAEVVVQAIEAGFPVPPVLADPFGRVPERLRLQPARPPLRLTSLLEEPRALEHLEVLRDRREAEIERGRQLRDRRLALGESREDGAPRRVGEGREGDAELVRLRLCLCLHFAFWLINLTE